MRLALAVVVVALLAPAAHADRANQAEARRHYEKATAQYDLAQYEAAIAEFKVAYELTHEPLLLFNIAQAYRLKKDLPLALHFYETYLELLPNAPNHADAEEQIAKLKEALAAPPAPPKEPEPVAPPAIVAPPPPPAPGFVHTRRGVAVIVLAVLGGGALAAAAGTGGISLSKRSQYDAGCDQGSCDPSLYASGRNLAIATDVLISVGAVAAITSIVLAATRPRARPIRLGMNF